MFSKIILKILHEEAVILLPGEISGVKIIKRELPSIYGKALMLYTTGVIEEGRIAYLSEDCFISDPIPRDEERQIYNFYEDIREAL